METFCLVSSRQMRSPHQGLGWQGVSLGFGLLHQGTSIGKEVALPVLLIPNVIDVNKHFFDPVSVVIATN